MCQHIQNVTLQAGRPPLIRLDKSIGRPNWMDNPPDDLLIPARTGVLLYEWTFKAS